MCVRLRCLSCVFPATPCPPVCFTCGGLVPYIPFVVSLCTILTRLLWLKNIKDVAGLAVCTVRSISTQLQPLWRAHTHPRSSSPRPNTGAQSWCRAHVIQPFAFASLNMPCTAAISSGSRSGCHTSSSRTTRSLLPLCHTSCSARNRRARGCEGQMPGEHGKSTGKRLIIPRKLNDDTVSLNHISKVRTPVNSHTPAHAR